MKKGLASFGFVLALTLGIALVPVLTSAAEFSYAGPPAFTVTYPDGSSPKEKTDDAQVLAVRTNTLLEIYVAVWPIPEGVSLKDVAEKEFKPGLEKGVKTKVKMGDNKEITLSDGTKAYYSEMDYIYKLPEGGDLPITAMMVSVYKDGKWINVIAYPWDNYNVPMKIVKSLKFK